MGLYPMERLTECGTITDEDTGRCNQKKSFSFSFGFRWHGWSAMLLSILSCPPPLHFLAKEATALFVHMMGAVDKTSCHRGARRSTHFIPSMPARMLLSALEDFKMMPPVLPTFSAFCLRPLFLPFQIWISKGHYRCSQTIGYGSLKTPNTTEFNSVSAVWQDQP